MRLGILTISDLGAVGQRADTSGDAILDWASERGYEVVVRSVVSDETDRIAGKLVRWSDSGEVDVVLTTGGTGLTERDVTPEATAAILEREAEGIDLLPSLVFRYYSSHSRAVTRPSLQPLILPSTARVRAATAPQAPPNSAPETGPGAA